MEDRVFLLVSLIFFLLVTPAFSQTLTIVYPWQDSRPAINARILAKSLAKHLNVKTVEFKYMPGANGIVVANYMYSLPDDSPNYTIGTFNRNIPYVGVIGGPNVNFDSTKFNWIGSTDDGRFDAMILLSHKRYDGNLIVGSDTIEIANPITFIQKHLGWNIKHVSGYKGNNSLRLAFERNEIDAMFVNINSIKYTKPEWIQRHSILFQFGNGPIRHEDLPHVETLYNGIADKKTLEQLEIQYRLVRPFVASPNMEPARLEKLRQAFFLAATDPEYLEEARKSQIVVNYIDWKTVFEIVNKMKELQ